MRAGRRPWGPTCGGRAGRSRPRRSSAAVAAGLAQAHQPAGAAAELVGQNVADGGGYEVPAGQHAVGPSLRPSAVRRGQSRADRRRAIARIEPEVGCWRGQRGTLLSIVLQAVPDRRDMPVRLAGPVNRIRTSCYRSFTRGLYRSSKSGVELVAAGQVGAAEDRRLQAAADHLGHRLHHHAVGDEGVHHRGGRRHRHVEALDPEIGVAEGVLVVDAQVGVLEEVLLVGVADVVVQGQLLPPVAGGDGDDLRAALLGLVGGVDRRRVHADVVEDDQQVALRRPRSSG